jgi:hypothetical protein
MMCNYSFHHVIEPPELGAKMNLSSLIIPFYLKNFAIITESRLTNIKSILHSITAKIRSRNQIKDVNVVGSPTKDKLPPFSN